MFIKDGKAPVPPGKEGTGPGCAYWPAYPCHDGGNTEGAARNKLKVCLQVYEDDPIVVNQNSKQYSHVSYMFDAMKLELYDVTGLIFAASGRRHAGPLQEGDWIVSCLGVPVRGGVCSRSCQSTFLACATSADKYKTCVDSMEGLCHGCSPTLRMLNASETPTQEITRAGAGWGLKTPLVLGEAPPSGSKCEWMEERFPQGKFAMKPLAATWMSSNPVLAAFASIGSIAVAAGLAALVAKRIQRGSLHYGTVAFAPQDTPMQS